jgi:rhamnogalacturonyl hydrolase YesR
MGKATGDKKYYDDACKQILQFAQRMFVQDKGLWMHGWSTNTDDHPEFYWARANGWAVMAMVELLDVLPEDHPQRADVMKVYKAHMKGLAERQSGTGLWHQLLDRNETYLETSASAIFTYCIAKGINKGWLNPVTYGPLAQIGWQAVTTKVNEEGGVEGTCVGTDLAYDPAYYYYRPTSVTAAHGYGPVLLAGAEMITLVKSKPFGSNFGVIHQVEGRGGVGGGGRGRGRGQ